MFAPMRHDVMQSVVRGYRSLPHAARAAIAIPIAVLATAWKHRENRYVQLAVAVVVLAALFGLHLATPHALTASVAGAFGITYSDIATTAVQDVQETFKRVYLMAVDAVPDSTALTAQLYRTRKFKAGPDGLYFNVKLQTGGAVANVPDGKLLPRATRPKRKQGKAGLAHTYTVVAVGGQSLPLTDDTRNAFVANLEDQLEDGMIRVKNDLERQYNGDGLGILCVIKTIAGAPTYGAQNPYGRANAGPGTMVLIEDMDVAILDPTGAVERGRSTIASIDPDAETFTTAAAVAGAQIGDLVVLCNDVGAAGTDKATNYGAECSGILAGIGTATFENIDPTQPGMRRWSSTIIPGNGAPTEKQVATLEARIRTKCGEDPDLHYTTEGVIISLQEQLAGRRQYTGETIDLKGGYKGLSMQGKKVLPGPYCPKGFYFALNTGKDKIGMVDLVKMGYVDLDGAKLHRVEGRHAYRADLWMPHNAIWFSRNAHGALSGLADDNTIVRY
jgi:hypothetical protein